MFVSRRCSLFLLVTFLASLALGENISRSACIGEFFELYHISFDENFTLVVLFKMDVVKMQIGQLSMEKSISNTAFINGYKDKMFLDNNGNICIRKLQKSDEGKYLINIRKSNSSSDHEVDLHVLVAPTTNCKPRIKQVNDVLTVGLDAKDCGRPAPSVYWMYHSGSFIKETKAIKLQPGKRAGVYHACIEGDAMKCVKSSNLSDYCSFIKVDDEQPSNEQEGAGNTTVNTGQGFVPTEWHLTASTLTIVICLPIICGMLILFGIIYFIYKFTRKQQTSTQSKIQESDRMVKPGGSSEQPSHDQVGPGNTTDNTGKESDPMVEPGGSSEQPSNEQEGAGNTTDNTGKAESDPMVEPGGSSGASS